MATKRLTIYFPADAARALAALAARCNIGDAPDVLRAAIEMYAGLIELGLDGAQIIVRKREGGDVPYTPFTRLTANGHAAKPDGAESKDASRNFVFSNEVEQKLDWIKANSYLKTNAAAVRAALTSFGELVDVDLGGDKVIVRDADGNEHNFSPFMPHRSQRSVTRAKADQARIPASAA